MKDPKRFLTDAEKAEVLAAAGYQCQGVECQDRDLTGKSYEFDHIKDHALGGLTTKYQHQVLCKPCHLKKHQKPYSEQEYDFGSVWSDLREWQREALKRFIDLDHEKTFVLEAAPGAGKTMLAACAARYCIDHHPEINHVICIAPWLPILESMRKTFGRMQLDLRDKFHYSKKHGKLQSMPLQDVTLDTYSGFCNSVTVDVIEAWQKRNNFKFMLILDEVHHTNVVSGVWGPYAEKIANMASKILVMSGTYFRSDNKGISFLEYEGDRPKTHYSIDYTQCVRQRYVRQVSFRYHNPNLQVLNSRTKKVRTYALNNIHATSSKMMSAAKREVLDPRGIHVEELISDAWKELRVMRNKWPDAACLVVCKGGSHESEERTIHAIESKIKSITGVSPVVVTSDDSLSRGRISNFVDSNDPFLCAIRMVSEGVDVPRIRMVLFLSFTDSEMLFRQIVGRCVRYIPGKEDDTAALVIMPKFPVMSDFAERFEAEAKLGAPKTEQPVPKSNDSEDGESSALCNKCNNSPCSCYVVLDSEVVAGGGQIASSNVKESYIEIAKVIRDTCSQHQHANVVQLADAIQRSENLKVSGISIDSNEVKRLALRNIDRKISLLARYQYNGDFEAAWHNEIHKPYKATKAEIEGTWRTAEIQKLHEALKRRIEEVVCNA